MSHLDFQKLVSALPARPILEVLSALAHAAQANGPTGPLTFFLQSGATLNGWIASGYWHDERLEVFTLQVLGADSRPGAGIVYVEARSVFAIMVADAQLAARYLGFGQVDALDLQEAPSKLQVQRELVKCSNDLQQTWQGKIAFHFDESAIHWDKQRAAVTLMNLISVVRNTFIALFEDALARQTLLEKVRNVRLNFKNSQHINFANGILELQINLEAPAAERFNIKTMRDAIERIF